jgi:hypothetical protein
MSESTRPDAFHHRRDLSFRFPPHTSSGHIHVWVLRCKKKTLIGFSCTINAASRVHYPFFPPHHVVSFFTCMSIAVCLRETLNTHPVPNLAPEAGSVTCVSVHCHHLTVSCASLRRKRWRSAHEGLLGERLGPQVWPMRLSPDCGQGEM